MQGFGFGEKQFDMSTTTFVRQNICATQHLFAKTFVRHNIWATQHLCDTGFVHHNICPPKHLSATTFVRHNICSTQYLFDTTFVHHDITTDKNETRSPFLFWSLVTKFMKHFFLFKIQKKICCRFKKTQKGLFFVSWKKRRKLIFIFDHFERFIQKRVLHSKNLPKVLFLKISKQSLLPRSKKSLDKIFFLSIRTEKNRFDRNVKIFFGQKNRRKFWEFFKWLLPNFFALG